MSEFLAEARILVRPDTTRFRAQLQEEVARAVSQTRVPPIQVPIAVGAAGLAAASAATAGLAGAQEAASISTRQLGLALDVENTALGRGAVLLEANSAATLEAAAAQSVLQKQTVRTTQTVGQVGTAAAASGAGLLGLRGAVLTASAGFLGATVAFQAGIQAIQSAAALESELNVFRVTVGATADQMDAAAANARALGRDLTLPGVTALDAAQAQLQLARAGLEVREAIAGTRGSLQLATAAQIDFSRAADLVAGNLNAFGLAGDQAVRVADLLTGAANESQGSIEDMGIGLRQVAGAANLLGLTVEDTVALLTQLTRAGLAGSDAGTTLRVALVKLANPDVRAEVENLVGSLEDLDGNLDPAKIVRFSEIIASSGSRLEQTNQLYELFGENALRVFGLLGQEGVAGFTNISEATSEAGLAAETAGARMAGLEGDIEAMKNEASAAGLVLGQLASPVISSLAGGVTTTFRGINLLSEGIRNLVAPPREAATSITELRTEIERLEGRIADLRQEGEQPLVETLEGQVEELNAELRELSNIAAQAGFDLSTIGVIAGQVTTAIDGLIGALNEVGEQAARQTPDDQGLGVQQILNRVEGFDAAEVRARIGGDTNELLGVLQQQQAFLESQLERQFVQRRPALKRQLEQALLGTVNDIASIQKDAASQIQSAAADATRARSEADRAFIAALTSRREDIENSAAAAAAEGNVAGAIRLLNSLQALITQQIAAIRRNVTDEQARAAAIRQLRQARNQSQREEDALRAQQQQQAQENRDQIQDLNIQIAEERGNEAAIRRAIQIRINTLNKQIAAARGDQVKVKQLILEKVRLQNQLKELNEVEDENRETARQQAASFFFEQLQAQQGFAANLLGNLIPRDQTAGLVGVPAPVSDRISAEANAARGRALQAPTGGQVSTTNDILMRILQQLKSLNRVADSPEAIYQRKMGSAAMTGGGGNEQVM